MTKIFSIHTDSQLQQCALIDITTDNTDLTGYKILHAQDEHYAAIQNALPVEEKQAFESSVANQQIYYRFTTIDYYFVTHATYDADKPDDAEGFMQNGQETLFADSVFKNLYYHATEKEILFKKIEAGELCYSIFPATQKDMPANALPLLRFPHEISAEIKSDCKKIWWNEFYKNIFAGMTSFMIGLRNDPVALSTSMMLALFTTFTAAQRGIPFQNNQQPWNNLAKIHPNTNLQNPQHHSFPDTSYTHGHHDNHNPDTQQFPSLHDPLKLKAYATIAIMEDDPVKLNYALFSGYDPFSWDEETGFALVRLAAQYNAFRIIRFIAKDKQIDLNEFQKRHESVSRTNMMGISWLFTALAYGNYELAQKLVEWKVDINHLFDNFSLLHYFATDDIYLDKLKKVVELGGDLYLRGTKNFMPLHIAAAGNQKETAKYLIDIMDNRLIKSSDFLMFCIEKCSLEMVELALQSGCDANYNHDDFEHERNDIHPPVVAAAKRGDVRYVELLGKYGLQLDQAPKINHFAFSMAIGLDDFDKSAKMIYALSKLGGDFALYARNSKLKFLKKYPQSKAELTYKIFFYHQNMIQTWKSYQKELQRNPIHMQFIQEQFHPAIETLSVLNYIHFYRNYFNLVRIFKNRSTEQAIDIVNRIQEIIGTEHSALSVKDLYAAYLRDIATQSSAEVEKHFPGLPDNKNMQAYFQYCIEKDDVECMQHILIEGYEIDHEDIHRIIKAATHNGHKGLAWLVDTLEINLALADKHGITPMHVAAKNNFLLLNAFIPRLTRKHRSDLNSGNLFLYAVKECAPDAVEILLQNGLGDPNHNIHEYEAKKNDIDPLASHAVLRSDIKIMNLLFKYGLNLAHTPNLAYSMMFAAIGRNLDITFAIIKHCSDNNVFNEDEFRKKSRAHVNQIQSFQSRQEKDNTEHRYQTTLQVINDWKTMKAHIFNNKEGLVFIKNNLNLDETELQALPIKDFMSFYPKYSDLLIAVRADDTQKIKTAVQTIKTIPALENHAMPLHDNFEATMKINHQYFPYIKKVNEKSSLDDVPDKRYLLTIPLLILGHFLVRFLKNYFGRRLGEMRDEQINIAKAAAKKQKKLKNTQPKEIQIDRSNDANVLANNIKRKLADIEKLLSKTEEEKKHSSASAQELSAFSDRYNQCLTAHTKISIYDSNKDIRKLEMIVNDKISALKSCLFSLPTKDLLAASLDINNETMDAMQLELEKHQQYFLDCLSLDNDSLLNKNDEIQSSQKIQIHNLCDLAEFERKFGAIKTARQMMDRYNKQITKHEEEIIAAKNKIKYKPVQPTPTISMIEEKSVKQEPIPIVANEKEIEPLAEIKKPKKEKKTEPVIEIIEPKEKHIERIDIKYFQVEPETIKNDPAVIQVNELLMSIHDISHDETLSSEWKQDALHYLLAKSALLIDDLHKDKKIHFHEGQDQINIMFILRNNILHYPESCFYKSEKENIFLDFAHKFHAILNSPLKNLQSHGKCELIILNDLQEMSPFAFINHKNEKIDGKQADGIQLQVKKSCLDDIKILVTKCAFYLSLASNNKDEFAQQTSLQHAMYGVILKLRNKMEILKKVDKQHPQFSTHLFDIISRHLPDVVLKGNQLAHQISEDDTYVKIVNDIAWHGDKSIDLLELMQNITDKKDILCKKCDRHRNKQRMFTLSFFAGNNSFQQTDVPQIDNSMKFAGNNGNK